MKVREVIQEFIPCEVCGNRDEKNFYFHVFVHKGSQPYVRCGECKEEYYSTRAREIITRIEDSRRMRNLTSPALANRMQNSRRPHVISEKQRYIHPLVSVLSQI